MLAVQAGAGGDIANILHAIVVAVLKLVALVGDPVGVAVLAGAGGDVALVRDVVSIAVRLALVRSVVRIAVLAYPFRATLTDSRNFDASFRRSLSSSKI